MIVRRDGRQCGCGRKGCLETYCSATGVARTAREFLVARPEPSLLRDIPAEDIVSKDVFDAAVRGDKLAQDIFEYTGRIWVRLWRISLLSPARKRLSCLVDWQNQVIIS